MAKNMNTEAGPRQPVVVSACRTAVGRARKGTLAQTRPDDLGAIVLKEAIKRAGIKPRPPYALRHTFVGEIKPAGL